jgi:CO/xanthine dehydrogenase FAD-binding subunit
MSRNVAYARPDTLEDALAFLQDTGKTSRVVAGGTDVVPGLRSGTVNSGYLVDISGLPELKGIEENEDQLFIGSGVTLSEIFSSDAVARVAPALQRAARVFGSRQIRNMATIGGNICRASPAGDTLPVLYALDAQLELVSASSSRRVAVKDFIRGPGDIAITSEEILRGVRLKETPGIGVHRFEKVGNRKVLAVSIVSLAALVGLSDMGVIERVRLAWGSVAPTVVRSTRVEQFLTGKPLTAETLHEAFPLVQEAISPIDDIRASAAYRRRIAANLLFRLLTNRKTSDVRQGFL